MTHGRTLPESVSEQYQFHVDDSAFHVDVTAGVPALRHGTAESPALTIATDATTFVQIGAQIKSPLTAMVDGSLTVEGDPDSFERCADLLDLPVGAAVQRDDHDG